MIDDHLCLLSKNETQSCTYDVYDSNVQHVNMYAAAIQFTITRHPMPDTETILSVFVHSG
jgi:hypothetical protein